MTKGPTVKVIVHIVCLVALHELFFNVEARYFVLFVRKMKENGMEKERKEEIVYIRAIFINMLSAVIAHCHTWLIFHRVCELTLCRLLSSIPVHSASDIKFAFDYRKLRFSH